MKTRFRELLKKVAILWHKALTLVSYSWHKLFSPKKYKLVNVAKIDLEKYAGLLATDYEKRIDQPFIIRVGNTSNEPVKDVELLSAIKRFKLVNLSDQYPGLKISYGVPGIDYEDFLTNLLSYKYIIGCLRLSAWSNQGSKPRIQDLEMIIQQHQINGNLESWHVIPAIDKDQFIETIYDYRRPFKLDCFTSLKFTEIPPFVSFRVFLYPKTRY